EKARQIAPGIAGRLDLLAADREQLALHLATAETLVEEPTGIVAQYPNDRRAAALIDKSLEQREEQPAPDPLVLPVGRDVKGKDLAGEFRLTAAAAAAAETEDVGVPVDGDAHIARLAVDNRGPAELAPLRRQADEKRRRQNAGIGRAPGLDIE